MYYYLRLNENLISLFDPNDILKLYSNLNPNEFPKLIENALTIASYFGTTYDCEHFFSIMKSRKNKTTNRLTDQTLKACLRIATANQLIPNIKKVIASKTYHPSH